MTHVVGRDSAVATRVERYAGLYGWTVERAGGEWRLCFGNGLAGVFVPAAVVPETMAALRSQDALGPVIELSGPPSGSVFLAERNGQVLSSRDLPVGVRVLDCPQQVPIPPPGGYSAQARWAVPPDRAHRVLPLVATVIAAKR